jgi:hypothetical protein
MVTLCQGTCKGLSVFSLGISLTTNVLYEKMRRVGRGQEVKVQEVDFGCQCHELAVQPSMS